MRVVISKGKAVLNKGDLRCLMPRIDIPDRLCNKLVAKVNAQGQIAGNFRCERCHQTIEVKLAN